MTFARDLGGLPRLRLSPNSSVSVAAHLPLAWPDFADAPAASLWYPQGFAYDDAGWLYIHYAGTGLTVCAIVVYDNTYAYQGWFQAVAGGESIVAAGSVTGSDLVLWKRRSTDTALVEYAVGAMPANGAILGAPTTRIASGVGLQFSRQGNLWAVEQLDVDFGVIRSRARINLFSADFVQTGSLALPINVIGYQDATDFPMYPYVPKMQGFCVNDGGLLLGVGGSWIPSVDGPVAPTVADLGVVTVGFDGSVASYDVFSAEGVLDKWTALGLDPTRTENEGVVTHPSGMVHSMNISRRRPDVAGGDTGGIVIMTHGNVGGRDWSDIASDYAPINLSRWTDGMMPRDNGGQTYHPLTGALLNTMDAVIELMIDLQLPRVAWFSGAVTVALSADLVAPVGNYSVEILNLNNSIFNVIIKGVTDWPYTVREYFVFDDAGTWRGRVRAPLGVAFTRVSDNIRASTTGGTIEVVLKTYTTPRKTMGPTGTMDFDIIYALTAGATVPREFRVYINGTLIRRITATAGLTATVASYRDQFTMGNRGVENSQILFGETAANPFAGSSGGVQTEAIDTTSTMVVTIAAIPSLAGDTFAVEKVKISTTYGD